MTTYQVGDTWHPTATFLDAAGAPVNPSSVVITIESPAGTQTTPTVSLTTNVATTSVVLNQGGYWHAIFDPAGVENVEPDWVYATPLPFTPA